MEKIILSLAASGLIGVALGYFMRMQMAQAKANSVEALAEKRLIEAKNKEQAIVLKAKEKAMEIIDDSKKEEERRRRDIEKTRTRLDQRESMFDKKISEFDDRKSKLEDKVKEIQEIKVKVDQVNAHFGCITHLFKGASELTVKGYVLIIFGFLFCIKMVLFLPRKKYNKPFFYTLVFLTFFYFIRAIFYFVT